MQKKIIAIVLVIVVALAIVLGRTYFTKSKEIHYHAGFQVYKNDKRVDFSDLKYMSVKPCGDEKTEVSEDDQLEKAHLHDGVGDVVHVHREHALWKDLFINLKFSIPGDILVYKDGKKVENILSQPIQPYESMIFFIGKATDIEKKLENRVTRKHIQETELRSENCGTS